ncbi:MAG: glutamine amidotransferase-related protein, partial [Chthoniobacteraceae bacterium]
LDLTPPSHPLWAGLPSRPHVYFVHSYFPDPADPSIVTSRTEYGEIFAASAALNNVAGVQFHPEKSQEVGLGILRNFIRSAA